MIQVIEANNALQYLKEFKGRQAQANAQVERAVAGIIEDVRLNGDKAVQKYTELYDGVRVEQMAVSADEMKEAVAQCAQPLFQAMERSAANIRAYHEKQLSVSQIYNTPEEPVILGQLVRPLERVGIYVPGGKAVYPSTVLMNAIPAKIAGVGEVVMITPPDKAGNISPNILAAAHIAGVDKVYKVGGAQGVAALAYGTETIPAVDKITGPGNIYVATAKKQVLSAVGIDMIAGPSEVLVIADEGANPAYLAADMIAQAEHDELAAAILVTHSKALAEQVVTQLEKQTECAERKDIIRRSLEDYGAVFITGSLEESVAIANAIAPEHLEIMTAKPLEVYPSIKNAGAIFLGQYTPEPVGDYFAGPNHTLPTGGTARFSSPLGVEDFVKRTSLLYYTKQALEEAAKDIITFAESERLYGHANAIKIRFEQSNGQEGNHA